MLLEFLQDVLRIEPWIGVVEPGNKSQRNDVVLASVDPSAAVFFRGQRPTQV